MKTLVAMPVYNEERSVRPVLAQVLEYADDILVIDDGSTDDTPCLLAKFPVNVVRHAHNHGYGRSLRDAFLWAQIYDYDWVITMDCDEQHEPERIPDFLALVGDAVVLHQHHDSFDPPVQQLRATVANAQRYRDKWGTWPMEGWLRGFTDLGLLDWHPDAATCAVRRDPTPGEIEACRRRVARPFQDDPRGEVAHDVAARA